MKTIALTLLTGALLVGLAVALGVWSTEAATPKPAPQPNSASAATLEPPRANLGLLQAQLRALRDEVQALRERRAAAPAAAVQPTSQAVERKPVSREDVVEGFAVKHGSEAVDTSWAAVREDELEGHFETAAAQGSWVQELDCRDTMCRLEVGHNDDEARDGFIEGLLDAAAFRSATFFHRSADGEATIVYSARAGRALPDPRRLGR